jgi:hypothetical protein
MGKIIFSSILIFAVSDNRREDESFWTAK